MKKNNYSAMKIFIFLFGFVVMLIAAVLLKDLFSENGQVFIFSCISAVLIYIAAFLPIVTAEFSEKAAKLINAAVVYYKGMITYAVVSAADIILSMTVLPLQWAIIIQCAVLFVFFIYIFAACFTADHINSVQETEALKKSMIIELRGKSQKLVAVSSCLDESNKEIKNEAAKLAENMRYLSPAGSSDAYELECRMSSLLDSIISDKFFVSSGNYSKESLEAKLRDFDILYRQRKNIL